MAKPDLPKWVPSDDALAISDPGSTKKATGLIYKERPAFQFVNWLFNRISKWLLGLQGNYFDIVVGSSTQVTNHEATHTINDLDDTLVTAGTKVLFLVGTHTLTANLALSNNDISLIAESSEAIIDVSTFTITLSGLRSYSKIRVINAGAGDIIVSGVGSKILVPDIDHTVFSLGSGVDAESTGASGGRYKNGKYADFPPGTLMLFQQSSAPIGWTKQTTHNDKALRVVSGSVSSGGLSAFSSVFSKTATDDHALTVAEMPSHNHPGSYIVGTGGATVGAVGAGDGSPTTSAYVPSQGGGSAHSHNIDIRVQYVDIIIASKD